MAICVNCETSFNVDDGLNPFYCSQRCADENNKPTTGPAIIDDAYAHLREAHGNMRKARPRDALSRERVLRGAWHVDL